MKKQHKLLQKLSLGLASFALIAPLALSNISTIGANADTNFKNENINTDESRASFLKHSNGSAHQENLMKHAKTIFVQRGNLIYTAKANGNNMFPSTMNYFSTNASFKKLANKEMRHLKYHKKEYRHSHRISLLRHIKHESMFTEVAQLPKSYRIPNNSKYIHNRNTYSFKIKNDKNQSETLLKSEFKHGTAKQAKRAGFAYGPHENNAITVFSRYKPNNKKAIVPKRFKIRPDQTVWLVGHHTNSLYKIDRFHQAYYYNGQYKGWAYIGL